MEYIHVSKEIKDFKELSCLLENVMYENYDIMDAIAYVEDYWNHDYYTNEFVNCDKNYYFCIITIENNRVRACNIYWKNDDIVRQFLKPSAE